MPCHPKGSGLGLRWHHIPPGRADSAPLPHLIHSVVEDMAPGRRAWDPQPGGCCPEAPVVGVGGAPLAAELTLLLVPASLPSLAAENFRIKPGHPVHPWLLELLSDLSVLPTLCDGGHAPNLGPPRIPPAAPALPPPTPQAAQQRLVALGPTTLSQACPHLEIKIFV